MMGNRQSCKTLRESVQYSVILLGHKWKRNWDDDENDQKDKGNVEILISGSQAFKQRWRKNFGAVVLTDALVFIPYFTTPGLIVYE